jgi:hypothetical protein
MTRLHPDERPRKDQVARDLALWQELAGEPVALDVSAARARATVPNPPSQPSRRA